MANFKEIVTKAVIGKAKKISNGEYKLIPEEMPNNVLGCWIINHTFTGINNKGTVEISGSFDINVWYSYDNDTKTKVATQKYSYNELFPVTLKDNQTINDSSDIIVRSLRQPTVTDVRIIDNEIVMSVEKEMGVEVVGDTKLKITVEEDEDEYEIISDDTVDEINEDYLDS